MLLNNSQSYLLNLVSHYFISSLYIYSVRDFLFFRRLLATFIYSSYISIFSIFPLLFLLVFFHTRLQNVSMRCGHLRYFQIVGIRSYLFSTFFSFFRTLFCTPYTTVFCEYFSFFLLSVIF